MEAGCLAPLVLFVCCYVNVPIVWALVRLVGLMKRPVSDRHQAHGVDVGDVFYSVLTD